MLLEALLCILFLLLSSTEPSDVLSLGRNMCKTLPGLSKEQLEICREFPDVTSSALEGLQLAVDECQHQFRSHRWNCSSLSTKNKIPHSSVLFQRGFRESAFAYAITAAGVAHSVARHCSSGRLLACGCNPDSYRLRHKFPKKRGRGRGHSKKRTSSPASIAQEKKSSSRWKWGGCSHNVDFGIDFSQSFLDLREKIGDIQSKINLHNNEAGRLAVATNVQVHCKCHGYSASCGLKTCWKAAPDFRLVGDSLKQKFRSAIQVDSSNAGRGTLLLETKRRRKRPKQIQRPQRKRKLKDYALDLFYRQKSPTFCERDLSNDASGTEGRYCNITSSGEDGCGNMCCGRGYNMVNRTITEPQCKFIWCCDVKCRNVTQSKWYTVCK